MKASVRKRIKEKEGKRIAPFPVDNKKQPDDMRSRLKQRGAVFCQLKVHYRGIERPIPAWEDASIIAMDEVGNVLIQWKDEQKWYPHFGNGEMWRLL